MIMTSRRGGIITRVAADTMIDIETEIDMTTKGKAGVGKRTGKGARLRGIITTHRRPDRTDIEMTMKIMRGTGNGIGVMVRTGERILKIEKDGTAAEAGAGREATGIVMSPKWTSMER
jgi:hypothetical protein